ncbi:hypothetical protein ACTFSJ_04355 [Bacillus cereus group sp. MYBK12-2]|uniref:hypothetical protein n=1 Tax=Bacillus TaxID=1386 RepID=UPI0007724A53|nr:hypothetical protein [Bacillus cereus group sp. BfR-BA-00967]KXI67247.1 hypothetical protein ACS51_20975 [Bacillus cereus]MDX5928261.1 hypothetical protein [Bacillus cereus group sp. BfR-BA-00967]ONG74995.1 hypothetical protein BKK44_04975 [Bacillus cereus]HDR7285474.1 hypothetical protein [Bacillus paranthracis]
MKIDPISATILLEQEIIEEKLKQGINGLEWLVLQVVVDEERAESLISWERLQSLAAKKKVNSLTLFSDAIRLDAESFYEIYELNWWMALREALTYFSLMRMQRYDMYFEVMKNLFTDVSALERKEQ